jgi:hypothetical protein
MDTPITASEYRSIVRRVFGGRADSVMRSGSPARVLALISSIFPMRLEFEVARYRGLAFDSGEDGFLVTVENQS